MDTAGVMVEKSASVNSDGHQAEGSVTVGGLLLRGLRTGWRIGLAGTS